MKKIISLIIVGISCSLFSYDLRNPYVIDSTDKETKAFYDTVISYNKDERPRIYLDTLYITSKDIKKNGYSIMYRYSLGKKPPLGSFIAMPMPNVSLDNTLMFDEKGNYNTLSNLNIANQLFKFNIYEKRDKDYKNAIPLTIVEPIIVIEELEFTKFYLIDLKSKASVQGKANLIIFTENKKHCKQTKNLKQVINFVDNSYICKYIDEPIKL